MPFAYLSPCEAGGALFGAALEPDGAVDVPGVPEAGRDSLAALAVEFGVPVAGEPAVMVADAVAALDALALDALLVAVGVITAAIGFAAPQATAIKLIPTANRVMAKRVAGRRTLNSSEPRRSGSC